MSPPRYAPQIELPRAPFVPGQARRPESRFEQRADAAHLTANARAALAWPHGVDLWNAGMPWEAHECFELLWQRAVATHASRGPATLLRGLIQACAALVHVIAERPERFARLAERAATSLAMEAQAEDLAPFAPGLDWRAFASAWREFAQRPGPTLAARPRLVLVGSP